MPSSSESEPNVILLKPFIGRWFFLGLPIAQLEMDSRGLCDMWMRLCRIFPGERAAATRSMSVPLVSHALHVRATGAVASCAAGQVCVGPHPIWPGSLGRQATWERRFESSRRSSIPAAAQRRRLGEGGRRAMRRLTDFDPPGC
jgi:hypothetical protein